jgi:DNA-binding response OmpR family regulator
MSKASLSMNLLIIADSAAASRRLTDGFAAARAGTRVMTPAELAVAPDQVNDGVDGLVIDVADPAGVALPLLRRLREGGHKLPLLLLAGTQPGVEAAAFNLGADAVLPRSAAPATLLARIEAIRRRAPTRKAVTVRCGNVCVDRDAGLLTVSGAPVEVTPCELRVLDMLLGARGGILGKERICDALHDGETDTDAGVLRVFVCRLRRKLAESGADDIIRTVWGVGYRVEAPSSAVGAAVAGAARPIRSAERAPALQH